MQVGYFSDIGKIKSSIMLLKLRYEGGKYVRVFFDYLVSLLSPCNAFEVSKFISLQHPLHKK